MCKPPIWQRTCIPEYIKNSQNTASKDTGKLDHSYIAGGKAKHSRYGKQPCRTGKLPGDAPTLYQSFVFLLLYNRETEAPFLNHTYSNRCLLWATRGSNQSPFQQGPWEDASCSFRVPPAARCSKWRWHERLPIIEYLGRLTWLLRVPGEILKTWVL